METQPISFVLLALLIFSILYYAPKIYYDNPDKHYRRLCHLTAGTSEFHSEALQVIGLCQIAIQQNSLNGDAHVMLAATYCMLAQDFPNSPIFHYCMPRCLIVITHCYLGEMRTKKCNSEFVYHTIMDYRLHTPIVHSSKDWGELYKEAIDPKHFEELTALVKLAQEAQS